MVDYTILSPTWPTDQSWQMDLAAEKEVHRSAGIKAGNVVEWVTKRLQNFDLEQTVTPISEC